MELLAREVAPGFRWQAPMPHPSQPYGTFAPGASPRVFMQTGPLGLGGYVTPRPSPQPTLTLEPQPDDTPVGSVDAPAVGGPLPGICQRCGLQLQPGARFCIRCGSQN